MATCGIEPQRPSGTADRRGRRPKVAKLAANNKLRHYVQDRLAGIITAADGTRVPGPEVRWIGRRHGPRQERRWASSWSPEQIAHRLRVDFPEDDSMRISHEAIYQALYVQGRGALRRDLGRVSADWAGASSSQGAYPGPRQDVRQPRDHDSVSVRRRQKIGQYPGTGKGTCSSGWAAPLSAPWSSARPGSRYCCTCPAWTGTAVRRSRTVRRWRGTAPRLSETPSRHRSVRFQNSFADH